MSAKAKFGLFLLSKTTTPVLRTIRLPIQSAPGFLPGGNAAGMLSLTTHLHLAPRLVRLQGVDRELFAFLPLPFLILSVLGATYCQRTWYI